MLLERRAVGDGRRGDQGTTRARSNPAVHGKGRPLFLGGDKAIVDAVERIAQARGVSMAQIGTAWVLKNPVVAAPIVGATKSHHLADAVAALDIRLTDEEIASLEEPYTRASPPTSEPPGQLRCSSLRR